MNTSQVAKITDIKQQAKRRDRYSVYLDGRYSFSLSESDLISAALKKGQELDDAAIDDYKKLSKLGKSYERALNLISHRPRSHGEVRDYLRRKDVSAPDIDVIIARLEERGYLDDKDFAERWVATRRLLKSTSQRRLFQELRQKQVPPAIIQEVLSQDETDEQQVLKELIVRKRRQTKYQNDIKLMQYLSRQGFRYDDIKSAMS